MKRVTLRDVKAAESAVQSAQNNYGERSQNYLNAMVRWREVIEAYAKQNPGKKLPGNPFLRNPRRRARLKRNPSSGVRIVHNKLLSGWFIVRGPHQTPLSGRFDSKAAALAALAASRAKRNPRRRAVPFDSYGKKLKKIARTRIRNHVPERVSYPLYQVQTRRGASWITLGAFFSQPMATDYARALADRYPSKSFRVFKPDFPGMKKNPISSADPRVAAAQRRFKRFTGHDAERGQEVSFPRNPGVGLAVGPVLLIGYETTRDGKREKYIHRFASHARPLLVSSHDGRSLYLLGGAYRFTERGIVDSR